MTPPNSKQLPILELKPFNPLDYDNLTKNVVDELMRRGPFRLPLSERFRGAGVYALFYVGNQPDYADVRSPDATQPVYVGKAVPAGARKGIREKGVPTGPQLYNRLNQHTKSIQVGEDLSTDDFLCRYLVVEPLWIVMAEQFLITEFRPLWNTHLDGFGNHAPGKGRNEGEITWWDARHPGRPWAAKLRQTRTKEQAASRVREYHALLTSDSPVLAEEARAAVEEESESDE